MVLSNCRQSDHLSKRNSQKNIEITGESEMKKSVQQFLETIFSKYQENTYQPGDVILSAGDEPSRLFFLQEGNVRQYVVSKEGEEINIHQYEKPALIPMMLVLSKSPNEFYFEATSKIRVYSAPVNQVLPVLLENHEFVVDLATRFAGAMNGLTKRVISSTASKQKEQLLGMLEYLASKNGTVSK